MTILKVHSVETLGTHEGPGLRLLVFLQGCNIRCMYCHNPDTWTIGPGKNYSIQEILKLVEKEKEYFGKKGGITISGGEPLVQRKEVTELFKELQKIKINTALDTNGTIFDNNTKELLEYTDLVLLDIKHINPVWQKKVIGLTTDAPLKFAEYREQTKKPFWIRYVLVSGYTDQEEFILTTAKHFKDYKFLERLEILPFHTYGKEKYKELGIEYPCKNIKPPTEDEQQKAKKLFEKHLKNVYIR